MHGLSTPPLWARSASRADWVCALLVLGLLVGGFASRAAWRALDGQTLAMSGYQGYSYQHAYLDLDPTWIAEQTGTSVERLKQINDPYNEADDGRDPWGERWVQAGSVGTHSRGPNGRDEQGNGDDVRLYPLWACALYNMLPVILVSLAIILAAVFLGVRVVLPHPPGLRTLGCASQAGLMSAIWALLAVALLLPEGRPLLEHLGSRLIVPPLVAAGLSGALLGVLFALFVSFTQPAPELPPGEEDAAQAP